MVAGSRGIIKISTQCLLALGFFININACVSIDDMNLSDPAAEEARCKIAPSIGKLSEVSVWAIAYMDKQDLHELELELETLDGGLNVNFLIKPIAPAPGDLVFDKAVTLFVNGVEYDLRNRQRYNRIFPVTVSTMTAAKYNEKYEPIIPDSEAQGVLVATVSIPGVKIDPSAALKIQIKAGRGEQTETHQFYILPKCVP